MHYKLYSKNDLVEKANTTFTWIYREEKYFYKLSSKHQEFWQNRYFQYTLNSYGFRCNDFSTYNKPTLAVLGCSHTFGTGLPIEKTWGWIVAQNLGLQLVNLGVPGGSMDTCSRVAKFWLSKVQPQITLVQIPELFRREFLTEQGFSLKGVWDESFANFGIDKWNEPEASFNYEKNLDLIRYYSPCTVIPFNCHKITEGTFLEQDGYLLARDGRHWGIEKHNFLAEQILSDLK
tara:strand:+ start:548 stop:1246 length:699 start_codon:yes stop_codon:yes gene_type:complete